MTRISQRATGAFVNATGKALLWAASALTADRTWTIPDKNIDFGNLGFTVLRETVASSDIAVVDWPNALSDNYSTYELEVFSAYSTVSSVLLLRLSVDGGATFLANGMDYTSIASNTSSPPGCAQTVNENGWIIGDSPGTTDVSRAINGRYTIFRSGSQRRFVGQVTFIDSAGNIRGQLVTGACYKATADSIRFVFGSGNIKAGAVFRLWGKR